MKGISKILTVILVVIIVVGLVGLIYTVATALFGLVTIGAEKEVEVIAEELRTQFYIELLANISETEVMIYIKNVGTTDINMSDFAIFLDGNRITDISC